MWLPSPLHVAFAPDGLRICSIDPLRRKVSEYDMIPIAPGAAGSGVAPWQAWVDALVAWLGQRSGLRFDVRIVLFDGFVRYQVLPWRAGISGNAEWQAYAGYRFREVYGEFAAAWRVQVATTPPGETALASAIDAGLLDALCAVVSKPSKLVSVQPRFVAGYNQWRHKLKGKSCWFATNGYGRVCLGFMKNGCWQAVRNETHDELSAQGMAEMLQRLDLTLDESAKAAPVFFAGEFVGQSQPTVLAGHALHGLQLPTHWSVGRRQLAMARGL